MPRLDALPLELIFHILSYTEPIYCLDQRSTTTTTTAYALNALAATNRALRGAAEAYARSQLVAHAGRDRSTMSGALVCRRKWLRDLCYFCKKKSQRRACFYAALTCCLQCDRREFAKMTMTEARDETHLSKLDLFTPSPLHPRLAPLATGLHMGSVATMISTPDVRARRAYIGSLLGEAADDEAYMRRRQARHERIMKHLNIDYFEGAGWVVKGEAWQEPGKDVPKKVPKSMRTREDRRRYAEEGLRREWEALGIDQSEDLMADIWKCFERRGKKRNEGVALEEYDGGESMEWPIEID